MDKLSLSMPEPCLDLLMYLVYSILIHAYLLIYISLFFSQENKHFKHFFSWYKFSYDVKES